MKNNRISFAALSRKLGRDVRLCETCGKDLMTKLWRVSHKDKHNISPETIKIQCTKCFTG